MILYGLWHEYYVPENDYDVVTRIAIYSTYDKAQDALQIFKQHPKFYDFPDAFEIAEIEVDKDGWIEGFISSKQ